MNANLVWLSQRLRIDPDTRDNILKFLVIGMVVFLSAGAGAAAAVGNFTITLALGLPTIMLLLWVLMTKKFELMVMALPFTALVAPIDIPTGTYSKIPISLLLTLGLWAIWLITMLKRNSWHFAPTILNRPAFAFCVACLISFIWSTLWRDPLINMGAFGNFITVQIASLLTFWASFGAALLIGNFANTELRLKYIFWLFISLGTLMGITETLHINQGGLLTDRGLWGLWTSLPAFCYLMVMKTRWRMRIALACVIALNLYQTFWVNLQWKSGWIPTIIGIYMAVFLFSRKWFFILILATATCGVIGHDFIDNMVKSEEDEGATERIGMWEINLRVIGDHWLFGTGPAGYAVYYMTYYPNDARSTHNNYLDIIAQFGIVGSITWLWFAISGIIEGLRQIKQAPPGILRVLAYTSTSGWIAAQFSMFFGDWLLPFAYNQTITGFKYTVYSWIFLGVLISIRNILENRKRLEFESIPA